MGVSIYYTAKRDTALSDEERAAIAEVIGHYSVDDQIRRYDGTGEGPDWESFCVYDPHDPEFPPDPGVIFEGATRLPSNSRDAPMIGARRWCRVLTEIRRILPDAQWYVHIEGYPLKWNETKRQYDPDA